MSEVIIVLKLLLGLANKMLIVEEILSQSIVVCLALFQPEFESSESLLELLLLHFEFLLSDQSILLVAFNRFFIDVFLSLEVPLEFFGFNSKAIDLLIGKNDSFDYSASLAIRTASKGAH